MSEREFPIFLRGKNTFRRQVFYSGVSLAGCTASFQIRNLNAKKEPTTLRMELTSGVNNELTITHLTEAVDVRGITVPAGSGVITLTITETEAAGIPVGEYLHELKIIWPESNGDRVKEPIWFGPFFRNPTINDA